jgi:hypothetical protein
MLGREQLQLFFQECGKDLTCDAVGGLIELLVNQQQQQQQQQDEEGQSQRLSSPVLINVCDALLHQPAAFC